MAKKPIICKLCGGEMEERKEIKAENLYYLMSASIVCKKCKIGIFDKTIIKARNKARKLMS